MGRVPPAESGRRRRAMVVPGNAGAQGSWRRDAPSNTLSQSARIAGPRSAAGRVRLPDRPGSA